MKDLEDQSYKITTYILYIPHGSDERDAFVLKSKTF